MKELQRAYRLRVLLCYVDTEDAVDPLAQVTKAALLNDCTLFCAWTPLVSQSETDLQVHQISALQDASQPGLQFTLSLNPANSSLALSLVAKGLTNLSCSCCSSMSRPNIVNPCSHTLHGALLHSSRPVGGSV